MTVGEGLGGGGGGGDGGDGGEGRHVALVGTGILVTRVLGYVRERVFAYYFGTSAAADAFRAALRIPNAIRNLLGEGTLSASFIPVYAGLATRGDAAAGALARAVLGLLLLGAGALAAIGIGLAPMIATALAPGFDPDTRRLTITLLRVLFPMSGLMVVSAWCLGVLNTHKRFFLPYAAPALWNVAGIAALLAAAAWLVAPELPVETRLHRLALALAWGTVAGAVLQVAVQLPACWRLLGGLAPRLSLAAPGVREVVTAWTPLVVGAGVAQISGLVDTILGSLLGAGGVASLSYAQIVQVLPVSLFGVSVAAVALPDLSRAAVTVAPSEALRARLAVAFRRVAFFVVPSAFAFTGLARVLVAALFQTGEFGSDDTDVVAGVLAAYGIGLLGAATVKLFSSGFYALRDTRTPVAVAVASLALSTGLAFALMRPLGAAGIALASSIGALANMTVNLALLERRIGRVLGGVDAWLVAVSVLGAGAATGAGALAAGFGLAWTPVPLALLVCAIFGITYFGVTGGLGHPDALRLWQFLRGSRAS
ncbi:MAG TPA: murein biosynthesis integral membrane protein MurJ [Gemmatimonadales bacterium]